ncbi:hypothetical protein Trydic_g7676 [Trypoxylus dichotomus]
MCIRAQVTASTVLWLAAEIGGRLVTDARQTCNCGRAPMIRDHTAAGSAEATSTAAPKRKWITVVILILN